MSELWKYFKHTGVIKTSQPAREEKDMELTGKLKEQDAGMELSAEEAKKILEEAGITLDDAELDQVAGGAGRPWYFYPGMNN